MAEQHQNEKTIHILKLVIVGIMCFAVIAFVFGVGIWVGQKRAEFSFRWAENYHKNFGGPKAGFFGNFPENDFTNSHGIFGPIIKINGTTITLKDQDGTEKTIITSPTTIITDHTKNIKVSDLKVSDTVVVIGDPDEQGQIEAKLIRIVPPLTFLYFSDFKNS